MYQSFWREMGSQADHAVPGWQSISYFSDVSNVCWFMEPEFASEVRRLHNLVGNAVASEDHFIIVGNGSTQLIQAALYALSPADAPDPISVVSEPPYYSGYPALTNFLRSPLYRWAGDAKSFQGDTYIEFVCYPNNPDGLMNEAVLNSPNGKTIHDLAYYWPQYTAITHTADHDIMLFTVSKSTGHAGTRLGWALVKDEAVAKKMTKFIELNTIGVSKDSQLRAAKILKAVSDGYEIPNPHKEHKLFDFGRQILSRRWYELREAVKDSGIFTLPDSQLAPCKFSGKMTENFPGFAWLKCEKEGADCESLLRDHKIVVRSGVLFGAGPSYARVSMLDADATFDLFVERLRTIN
ncbi:hypothetical protein Cni_G11677 [Canna indica]|uniref:Alliinase C-terminal domain-containing protein n=1 Tax=Canna indica TaxID=4628 RepID=A0AAQ3K6G8_9LILI|nr:hypothetical protein Cni_G11677 [Canna indica]